MALRVACLWVITFTLVYVATAMFPIPLPVFDPTDGTWLWAARPSPVQMRFYGQLAAAMFAGAAVAGPAAWAWRDRPAGATSPVDRLFAGWAAVATALCLAYYAWHNWP